MRFLPVNLAIRSFILIAGFGNVGERKALFLANLGFPVTVVDKKELKVDHPNIELRQMEITRGSIPKLLASQPDLVIVAIDDTQLSEEITEACRQRGVPVNVVDNSDLSDVIFSSILNSGSLSFAISTQGHCPFYTKQLRKEFTPLIEERGRILDVLAVLRRECENPTADLPEIYADESFRRKLSQNSHQKALERGREILRCSRRHI